MRTRRRGIGRGACGFVALRAADADVRIRGPIQAVDGSTLTVKAGEAAT